MRTTFIIHTLRPLASVLCLLALSVLQPFSPSALSKPAPAAKRAAAYASDPANNIPGIPQLPLIVPYYDAKGYAWVWNAQDKPQAWSLIPRDEARILYNTDHYTGKQITGTLTIDGCYDVPVVSGQNIILLFRKEGDFKTYKGLPAGETGIEVVKLDVTAGSRKGQLIRTAQLQREGDSAATFGDKREPITVQTLARQDGVFHSIQVTRALPAGRYALYLPDRAFEFEVR